MSDCGCKVVTMADFSFGQVHSMANSIVYCPLHAAAPEMLDLLRKIRSNRNYTPTKVEHLEALDKTIAKAEGGR